VKRRKLRLLADELAGLVETGRSVADGTGYALDARSHSLHVGMVPAAKLNASQFIVGLLELAESEPIFGGLHSDGMFEAKPAPRALWKVRPRHCAMLRCHTAGACADQAFAYRFCL
jgi:hypothetical protein